MIIAEAEKSDLPEILNCYMRANEYMHLHGNPDQWPKGYPDEREALPDLQEGRLFVIKDNNFICGVFSLFYGNDPTYEHIYEGSWFNDKPYVVIHRLESNGRVRGIGRAAINYALTKCSQIRIDTHRDNKTMQNLLDSMGFVYCGKIICHDGTERLAYQYSADNESSKQQDGKNEFEG